MTQPGKRPPSGFTLLEVLAALAVFAMVLLTLTQGMRFGMQASRSIDYQQGWRYDLQTTDRTLRLAIERTISGEWLKNRAPLLGQAEELDLVTVLPLSPEGAPDGTVEAKLAVDGGHRLILRWEPHLHAAILRRPPAPRTDVLLTGVERLELAYWRALPGGGGSWQRDWGETDPPSLVRLRIVFPPGDRRHWPDIVAAPRLGPALSWRLHHPSNAGSTTDVG